MIKSLCAKSISSPNNGQNRLGLSLFDSQVSERHRLDIWESNLVIKNVSRHRSSWSNNLSLPFTPICALDRNYFARTHFKKSIHVDLRSRYLGIEQTHPQVTPTKTEGVDSFGAKYVLVDLRLIVAVFLHSSKRSNGEKHINLDKGIWCHFWDDSM